MDHLVSKHDCKKHAGWRVDVFDCPFCLYEELDRLKRGVSLLIEDWEDMYKELSDSSNPDCASGYRICADQIKAIMLNEDHQLLPELVKEVMREYKVDKN